jgi:class 3 adenylate cyclase
MKLSDLLDDPQGVSFRDALARISGLRSTSVQDIIDDELSHFESGASVTVQNRIPRTSEIPIQNPTHWIKVPDIVACFVDMEGSTRLSATAHERRTAKTYRLFTSTAVRIFHHFQASYIDVKGDGVFALFDSDKCYTALAATVSFKTFVQKDFTPKVRRSVGLEIGGHFGIDTKTVLVRKLGLKLHGDRTDRQNEVWAGKPVNMAAKLAGRSSGNTLLVSDRFYNRITDDLARFSCGCPSGEPVWLWSEIDLVEDRRFDFDKAYSLKSDWCETHGKDYCRRLVRLDE